MVSRLFYRYAEYSILLSRAMDFSDISRDPRYFSKRKKTLPTRSVGDLFKDVEPENVPRDKRGRPWSTNPTEYAKKQIALMSKRKATDSGSSTQSDDHEYSSESSSDEQNEFELTGADLEDLQDAPTTDEATRRLAILHFDWDNSRVEDIYSVLESFLPPGGVIDKVTIHTVMY
ncbi:unnamed protein product [Protopolystoma xenopodis]|uniref:ESF1 RRM domain-containing protein n=1 Tax=Protopolystoma xenopodis TaxID=117903 RepID=A0A3S5AGI3_9PLAT|nr:unnamed protein product [Protopolystoma xenopodis]